MRHLLIIGSGSVGKRHAANFTALGCAISCVDPRADRRAEVAAATGVRGSYATREEALAADTYDGVVVCTPTAVHRADVLASVANGLPVLLEKPAAESREAAQAMADAAGAIPILLGYTWRWWPALQRMRSLILGGAIGRVLSAQFHMSAHLADWHPWEPYQEFFMASAAQGGGALLDESHWIDMMIWLFGMPHSVFGLAGKISSLEIDSDDAVDSIAVYDSGLRVSLHLDLFGRPHEKSIRCLGEEGTLVWTADSNRLSQSSDISGFPVVEDIPGERNDMFVAVAQEFLQALDGAPPSCNLRDGLAVLDVIEAIRESTRSGCLVTLGSST